MLKWALIFLVIALIAGILGLPGVASLSIEISRILFFIFVSLFIIVLIFGTRIFR